MGGIADGEYARKALSQKFVQCCGVMMLEIDVKLGHGFDCRRTNVGCFSSGAEYNKAIAGRRSQQPFRHLEAG